MTDKAVHFELFMRRDAGASWTLELATEARGDALDAAATALADKQAIAVKIHKETRDPSTGDYRSLVVFSEGDLTPPKKKGRPEVQRAPSAPPCVSPSDLYTVHARERIGRLLEGWLRRERVTPFELLHRPDLVERLDATGLELQHAMQKLAIPEAQARGVSVHEAIRGYQKLVEAAVSRLLKDERRGLFPRIGSGADRVDLAEAVRRAQASGEPAYVLGVAVARAIAEEASWAAKIGRLLDLAEGFSGETGRNLLFGVVAQPLSEMLDGHAALDEFLGSAADLGRSLALMMRLAAPETVQALSDCEPSLARVFPAVGPEAARLARWLGDPALSAIAATLVRRTLAELQGPRRLHPTDPAAEILTLRGLARVLAMSPRLAAAEDVQAAFVERSHRLVAADFVQLYIDQAGGGAIGEAHALARLAENVVGAANRRAAGTWLKAAVGAPRFERALLAAPETPAAKLLQLAELQRALAHTGLEACDQAEVATRLGEVGGVVETEARLLQHIAQAGVGAAQRLAMLLRFTGGEAAPLGPVSQRARQEAARLLREPAFRADLAGSPEMLERVRPMLQSAGLAA